MSVKVLFHESYTVKGASGEKYDAGQVYEMSDESAAHFAARCDCEVLDPAEASKPTPLPADAAAAAAIAKRKPKGKTDEPAEPAAAEPTKTEATKPADPPASEPSKTDTPVAEKPADKPAAKK